MQHRQPIVAFLAFVLVTCPAAAQQQPMTQQPQKASQQEQIPWPVHLGLRVLKVEQAFALIDRIVLVPDAATYVDELSKWSPHGRWPVLFEDDHLAPMFIRRFRPSEVIRRESVGETDISRESIERLLVSTFGGLDDSLTVHEVFAAHGFAPPGVVVASMNDPAWTAAAALAIGRGQPLIWIDRQYSQPDNVIEEHRARELANLINQGLDELGWSYDKLGDDIETITLCRSVAGRVNLPRPDNGETEPAAMTDYLGRDQETGERWAFVGWVYGDEVRSAYMAMCSLFLPRTRVTMYDTYGSRDGEGWDLYNMTAATAVLSERGFEVTHLNDRRTNETGWLGMIAAGLGTDVFVMNSSGNPFEFHVYDGRIWPPDVPILNTPAALHLTHSWSMRSPQNRHTVGGRWLERGVYAYVGSMQEPYLAAFLPPINLVGRWVSHVPFLVGSRYWSQQPSPFSGPWKVNTIGDPLMLLIAPTQSPLQRTQQPAGYGQDLNELAQQLLLAVREEPDGPTLARAIALLDLLGRDEIALPLWKLAESLGQPYSRAAAAAALGPLFRARDLDAFMRAWRLLDHHDDLALDMLWHLHTPRLATLSDDDLLTLQAAVRDGAMHVDLRRLAPHLADRFGHEHVRSLLQRVFDESEPGRHRNNLQPLLREYQR